MSALREAAQQALGVMMTYGTAPQMDAARALRAALEQPNECRWLQEGDEESDTWAASCGRHRYFSLNEGTPKDNHMKHCCYCGKPLVEVPIEPEDNHD
jgi:hypothetical protein